MTNDYKYLAQSSRAETTDRFARHISSGKVEFFRTAGIDFVMGRREGPFLWDVTGDPRLIDCHCNGAVYNLGHRNPEVARVLADSLRELDIGTHHLISEQRAALAAQLAELMPGDISYTVFGVSGGEAIDLAIKVARGYTGRPKVISAQGGYHGHTGLALAAGDEKYRAPFGPLSPGFVQVPFDDVAALVNVFDDATAAVLFEPILATCGMPVPDHDFFPRVRELCDRRGALLIVDEVQTGLGRTGKLWGIQHFGVVPDIIVIGSHGRGGVLPLSSHIRHISGSRLPAQAAGARHDQHRRGDCLSRDAVASSCQGSVDRAEVAEETDNPGHGRSGGNWGEGRDSAVNWTGLTG